MTTIGAGIVRVVQVTKSAIAKRKKELLQVIDDKTNLRENPYLNDQVKLNEKINDFVRNLSINSEN